MSTAADPLLGRSFSHYTLLERIGEGGMGVVYRARDERLPREVAVKFLSDGLPAAGEARARFHREAIALSRLRHPSIALLYEFDQNEGRDYLVLELVAGETLETRLSRGRMSEAEVRAIGEQLAGALEAAHAQGVVHRDFKPGNVVLTADGTVKVLDFGVARLIEPFAGDTTRTSGGVRLGTLAYMAPEQMFSSDVDARADLYALGAVLYHMATGQPPFANAAGAALAHRILNEPPAAPRALRPELSAAIEAVILRCLEKQAVRRPGSAGEIAAALRGETVAGPSPAVGLASLVVLPLENLSGDPAEEYFADGMTDTLITALAQIGALRVISRTSAMQYKGARPPLAELVRTLGVGAVIEGTVLRDGDRVRISAQLVDARADRALWAHSYDRDLGDVLGLQNEVARSIAEEVRIHVTPKEHARLVAPHVVDPRAIELYLRARFFWGKRTTPALLRSVDLFREVLEIDPSYAAGWAGLADAWNILGVFRIEQPAAAFARAREAAARAMALEPDSVEAQTSLAFAAHYSDWDWARAERGYRRAIALRPGYVSAHHWFSDFLSSQGRHDEALAQSRESLALDPLSAIIALTEGAVLYFARRYDESEKSIREQIDLHPDSAMARLDLGRALEERGDFDGAIRAFEMGTRISGADPAMSSAMAHGLARAGRREEAETILHNIEASRATRYVSPYTLGMIRVALGDAEGAFVNLEQALEGRDPMMTFVRVHPRLDPLRGDPRFAELVRRVGLAP